MWVGVKNGVGGAVATDLGASRTTSQFRTKYSDDGITGAANSDNYTAPLTRDYSGDSDIYHPRLRIAYTTF